MTHSKDRRKEEKDDKLLACMSSEHFVTRGYLRLCSGVSCSGVSSFLLDIADDIIVEKAKCGPGVGRAEAIYKLK